MIVHIQPVNLFFSLVLLLVFAQACDQKKGSSDPPSDLPPVKEEITDEELIDLIQEKTFAYFWDYAHPVSGLIRERAQLYQPGTDEVTIGGSGFGVMAILVGIERGFISREEGLDRLIKMVDFLEKKADRFHGAWPHWINGSTGKTLPFSQKDDGGDLVESAFMFQGLLAVRQYFSGNVEKEQNLREMIDLLWGEMEWDWYTQGGQNILYWHWSPNYGWEMNHKITGWNEALIVYVLAAASENHGIDAQVYHEGWSRNGDMVNGHKYYNMTLPLGSELGGPLFFAHYSFLGLDPRNLKDQYADYWQQNVQHTLINYQYCVDNPKDYRGYSEGSWGLTASYSTDFYSAHSPTNDLGVITPTAALSSFPYSPEESMQALRWMYQFQNGMLFQEYGFVDAYSLEHQWFSDGYLAIDQGPIVIMIENYRTNLLWNLFMSAPEVQNGLDKLGFSYK